MSSIDRCMVVLAAGKGSRTFSGKPKVLQLLAGRPLLFHVLETAFQIPSSFISVVVGYGADEVRQAFDTQKYEAIKWVQQMQQLGTGHAVSQALQAQKNAFNDDAVVLVLYGDVPFISNHFLEEMFEAAHCSGICVLSKITRHPDGYGRIVRDQGGAVHSIIEHKDATPNQRNICEVNTGIMAVRCGLLKKWLSDINNNNAQQEFYLTDVVAKAFESGHRVGCVQVSGDLDAVGVNDFKQLALLERSFQRHNAFLMAKKGLHIADPLRIDVRGHLSFGADVFVDFGCLFLGDVHLSDGVQIGPNCVLHNCTIEKNTHILAGTVIKGSKVGQNSVLGPYAHVHSGSLLQEKVHVGNFVEVKKSQLGSQTKAKHLAYLGDATLGEKVNFGAGSVVCNFDGKKKHPTFIGDNAFVGSNSALIAPIKVGADAFVGAGSVISKDAPSNQLTLTRAKQTTLKKP